MIPHGVSIEQVDIWFQDEARVGQQGTITRIWAKKGTRPRVVRQKQFVSAYIFGAACPQRDTAVGLVLPCVNSGAMQLHIDAITATIPDGRHAVIVADQAGWHVTNELKLGDKISFLPLPPASPELNPMERVWEQLREDDLANRCYKDYGDVVDSCCNAWNKFVEIPESIRKMCSRTWANLENYFP